MHQTVLWKTQKTSIAIIHNTKSKNVFGSKQNTFFKKKQKKNSWTNWIRFFQIQPHTDAM